MLRRAENHIIRPAGTLGDFSTLSGKLLSIRGCGARARALVVRGRGTHTCCCVLPAQVRDQDARRLRGAAQRLGAIHAAGAHAPPLLLPPPPQGADAAVHMGGTQVVCDEDPERNEVLLLFTSRPLEGGIDAPRGVDEMDRYDVRAQPCTSSCAAARARCSLRAYCVRARVLARRAGMV